MSFSSISDFDFVLFVKLSESSELYTKYIDHIYLDIYIYIWYQEWQWHISIDQRWMEMIDVWLHVSII